LFGFDPWFYDIPGNEVTHTIGYSAPVRPFFRSPWFGDPWVINKSGVNREWTAMNDGDLTTYPVWTIAGPGKAPRLENQTTGKLFILNYTLAVGETVTLDTRDNAHTVESNLHGNLRPYMDATNRAMWPLIPGSNELAVELNGTVAGAAVEMAYLCRFEGV
jgi:hypothetical protein